MKTFKERAEDWLKTNPPPPSFAGSPIDWAALNMPSLPGWLLRLLGDKTA